jgi:hypothetical protein
MKPKFMGPKFMGSLVTFAVLLSGNVFAAKGHGSSDMPEAPARPDVSKDNGMYFFCENDKVIIQNCAGKATKPGKGCDGERREVKKDDFIKELLSEITIDKSHLMKPLSPDDIKVAKKRSPKPEEVMEFVKGVHSQTGSIDDLIKEMRGEKIGNIQLDELQRRVADLLKLTGGVKAEGEAIVSAIDKVNNALAKVVDQVCDSKVTINLNSAEDKDTLLHTVLKQYDPKAPKKEILMKGRLEKTFVAADHSGNRFKIFDTVTKLTWHDIYGPKEIKDFYETMSPKPTFEFDGKQYPDYFKAASALCVSKGLQAPTKEDLEVLAANRELAKNLGMDKGWFWSSSERSSGYAWYFFGDVGVVLYDHRDYDGNSVSCVSRGAGR